MKRLLKLLFVVLVAFCFIPFVHAVDDSEVTYFLSYPDGSEEVVETAAEATNLKEKVLFSGRTDANGQIVLDGLNNTGTIRIVQEVPNGYSTNKKEITVNLAENSSVGFVNYRGLSNPNTGRTLFYIIVIIAVIGTSIFVILWNKKVYAMVLLFAVCFFAFTMVKAWTEAFTISVLDGNGKAIPNVKVTVYGVAKTEAVPAIKLDANGGHFFDGKEVIWIKLPENGCSTTDLMDSYSNEEQEHLMMDINYAYREGYSFNATQYMNTIGDGATLNNGTVYKINWSADSSKKIITFVGNGGYFPFYGDKLEQVTFYKDSQGYNDDTPFDFINDNKFFLGTDDGTSKCSRYNEYGVLTSDEEPQYGEGNQTVYLCWHSRPDGIYVGVRDENQNSVYPKVFIGNDQSCFAESYGTSSSNVVGLYNYDNDYLEITENRTFLFKIYAQNVGYAPIQSIVVIDKGETIIDALKVHIGEESDGTDEKYSYFSEEVYKNTFTTYMQNIKRKCFS